MFARSLILAIPVIALALAGAASAEDSFPVTITTALGDAVIPAKPDTGRGLGLVGPGCGA
ncbi:MAG TPA: hypothetical protein VN155_11505 [Devosia sp.]|nr:hypothetical protein [Devosia sp.]